VHDDDDLPRLICSACVAILELIENFQASCSQSIDYIRELIVYSMKEELLEPIVTAEPLESLIMVKNELNGICKDITPKRERITTTETNKPFEKVKYKGNRIITISHITPESEIPIDEIANKEPLPVKKPMCELCGKTFANMITIREHMKLELLKIQGKALDDNTVPENRSSHNLHCRYEGCQKYFKNPERLTKHLKKHKDDKVSFFLGCIYCFLSQFYCPIVVHLLL
jgi:hypothetical protein